jgi:hypothetical protein
MPITFDCACGKTLRVPDEHAGRRAKCPVCNAVVSIPAPDPVFEIVEEPEPAPAAPEAAAAPAATPRPPARPYEEDNEEFDGTTYGLANEGRKGRDGAKPGDKSADKPRGRVLPRFRKGTSRHK